MKRKIKYKIDKAKKNTKDIRWDYIVSILKHIGFSVNPRGGSIHYISYPNKDRPGFVMHKPHGKDKCNPHDIEKAIEAIEDHLGEKS